MCDSIKLFIPQRYVKLNELRRLALVCFWVWSQHLPRQILEHHKNLSLDKQ